MRYHLQLLSRIAIGVGACSLIGASLSSLNRVEAEPVPLDIAENTVYFAFEIPEEEANGQMDNEEENFQSPEGDLETEKEDMESSEASSDELRDGSENLSDSEKDADTVEGTDEEEFPIIQMLLDDFPTLYEQYARVQCEDFGLDVPVYWGDEDVILDWGAGTSTFAYTPGSGKPVILSGHTLTHFACLQNCEVGDVIVMDTKYGKYEYEVVRIEVYNENDLLDYFYEILDYKVPDAEDDSSEKGESVEDSAEGEDDLSAEVFFLDDENGEDESSQIGAASEENDSQQANSENEVLKRENGSEENDFPEKNENETSVAKDDSDPDAEEDDEADEQPEILLMYTCYPFYPISERKTNRYTVIAERISGNNVEWVEELDEDPKRVTLFPEDSETESDDGLTVLFPEAD